MIRTTTGRWTAVALALLAGPAAPSVARAQDPVLVPPLPVLAPAAPRTPEEDLRALQGATRPPGLAPADIGKPGAADGPPLPSATGAEALARALEALDPDTLRLLGQMSPEEIAALSREALAREAGAAGPDAADPADVLIQAGSFLEGRNAEAGAAMIARRGLAARVQAPRSGAYHRLLVGPVPANAVAAALATLAEIGFADAFTVPR